MVSTEIRGNVSYHTYMMMSSYQDIVICTEEAIQVGSPKFSAGTLCMDTISES